MIHIIICLVIWSNVQKEWWGQIDKTYLIYLKVNGEVKVISKHYVKKLSIGDLRKLQNCNKSYSLTVYDGNTYSLKNIQLLIQAWKKNPWPGLYIGTDPQGISWDLSEEEKNRIGLELNPTLELA